MYKTQVFYTAQSFVPNEQTKPVSTRSYTFILLKQKKKKTFPFVSNADDEIANKLGGI